MQPIYTLTVTSGSPTSIAFNNIPQTYTDLFLVTSDRSVLAAYSNDWIFYFNGLGDQLVGSTLFQTNGAGAVATGRLTNYDGAWAQYSPAASATTNGFGYSSFYIPNYSSNNFKQMIAESVAETNSVDARLTMNAHSWRNNAPIKSLSLTHGGQTIAIGSTATLYGIAK